MLSDIPFSETTTLVTLSEFFLGTFQYTVGVLALLLLLKYVVFITLLEYLFGGPRAGGSAAGSVVKDSPENWWRDLSARDKLNLSGRLAFTVHHSVVALLAVAAMVWEEPRWMIWAMFFEIGADWGDIFLHAVRKELTGLNRVGLVAHHVMSLIMISASLVYGIPTVMACKFAILLDGTGGMDFFFFTFVPKTPYYSQNITVFASCVSHCIVFFFCRLFYFPFLAVYLVSACYGVAATLGHCAVLTCLAMFWFSGMMVQVRIHNMKSGWKALKMGVASAPSPVSMV